MLRGWLPDLGLVRHRGNRGATPASHGDPTADTTTTRRLPACGAGATARRCTGGTASRAALLHGRRPALIQNPGRVLDMEVPGLRLDAPAQLLPRAPAGAHGIPGLTGGLTGVRLGFRNRATGLERRHLGLLKKVSGARTHAATPPLRMSSGGASWLRAGRSFGTWWFAGRPHATDSPQMAGMTVS